MKITFVLPFSGLQGGIRVLAIYADKLSKRGHDVSTVETPWSIPLKRKIKSLVLGRGWPKNHLEGSHFDTVNVPKKKLDKDRYVVDTDVPDADVVVSTYYPTNFGVINLSPSKGAKAFFIQNYELEPGKSNDRLDATWRMPVHKIVISKWLAALASDKFGDHDVSHVPNSVDLDQFHAEPREKAKRPTVGLLYSTSWMKGCRTALEALKQVEDQLPGLRLISFGAEKPGLDLPLPSYAEFHYQPAQSKLRELYAQCDLWLCGSAREGFHLPPLEAMACRCPVVSTRVGGPEDTVIEGINGYTVDIGDTASLGARLLEVLKLSPIDWKKMSDAAYATATGFSWDDATLLFEKALEHAIERTRRGDFRRRTGQNPPEPSLQLSQDARAKLT
jgi:glycosyltransferase involved in cell wall biosynthesis